MFWNIELKNSISHNRYKFFIMNKKDYKSKANVLSTLLCFFIFSIGVLLPAKGQVFDNGPNTPAPSPHPGVTLPLPLPSEVSNVSLLDFLAPPGNDRLLVIYVNWISVALLCHQA